MPSTSKKQHNFMAAVANNSSFAKKAGVPQSVGKEFNQADKGRKFSKGGDMKKMNMGGYADGGMPMKDGKPAFVGDGKGKMAKGGMAKADMKQDKGMMGDGIAWAAAAADASYDVVLVDGSDPAGPAEGLFNRAFFENCRRILKPGGVFATQSESPEAFRQVHIDTVRLIREVFGHADPLYGWVPMYPSGWWSWTFAATDGRRYLEPNSERAAAVASGCEIWSPRWQQGAFNAIPAYVERALTA